MLRASFNIAVVLGLVLPCVGVWLVVSSFVQVDDKQPARSNETVMTVDAMHVSMQTSFTVERSYTGRVVPRRVVELAFVESGQIVTMAVQDGDRVVKGQPLARLDVRRLQANRREQSAARDEAVALLDEMIAGPRPETITAARAKVKEFNAEAERSVAKLARREELIDRRTITEEEYDEVAFGTTTSRARLTAAQSDLELLLAGTRSEQIDRQRALVKGIEARLAQLDVRLDESELKAPFAGRISERLLDKGAVVAAGEPVYRLVEIKEIEVWVGVPIPIAEGLAPGSVARLRIGDRWYEGRVVTLLPEVDSPTLTITAVLRLSESAGVEMHFGQLAKLTLEESVDASGCWLPMTALEKGPHGLWSCFAITPAETATEKPPDDTGRTTAYRLERRDVEVIHVAGDRVFVRGILSDADRIVRSGTHRVVPGQRVRLRTIGKPRSVDALD